MKKLSLITLICVLGLATSVIAEPITDDFWARVNYMGGVLVGGGGSGHSTGQWYHYPLADPGPEPGPDDPVYSDWLKQWYYDHPVRPDAWKWIEAVGTVKVLDPFAIEQPGEPGTYVAGWITVAINYTTEDWLDSFAPPVSEGDQAYIVRETIFAASLYAKWNWVGDQPEPEPPEEGEPPPPPQTVLIPKSVYGYTEIPDYNPEWVSIEVRGYNFNINGQITHECIPEPATLSLLAMGGLAMLRRRRK